MYTTAGYDGQQDIVRICGSWRDTPVRAKHRSCDRLRNGPQDTTYCLRNTRSYCLCNSRQYDTAGATVDRTVCAIVELLTQKIDPVTVCSIVDKRLLLVQTVDPTVCAIVDKILLVMQRSSNRHRECINNKIVGTTKNRATTPASHQSAPPRGAAGLLTSMMRAPIDLSPTRHAQDTDAKKIPQRLANCFDAPALKMRAKP